MKITFLGVAGALSSDFNSNMLIEAKYEDIEEREARTEYSLEYIEKNYVMLFDCGEDVNQSLQAAGRKPEELDGVYISHLHTDHCGGLSWLAYYSYFIMQRKLKLFVHESLIFGLWSMLAPSMEKLHGKKKIMTLEDYFDLVVVGAGRFNLGGMQFYAVKQDHVITPYGNMSSYGLRGYGPGDWCGYPEPLREHHRGTSWRFFISSDTCKLDIPNTSNNHMVSTEYDYDYIFSDCDVMNLNGVHPNYNDLKELDKEVKKRMWLYHYTDLSKYDGKYGEMPDAVADGFAGFVKQGQVFEF